MATLQNATFSAPYKMTPGYLQTAPALVPNPSGFLEIQFNLSTSVKDATPVLKGYRVIYECPNGVG